MRMNDCIKRLTYSENQRTIHPQRSMGYQAVWPPKCKQFGASFFNHFSQQAPNKLYSGVVRIIRAEY